MDPGTTPSNIIPKYTLTASAGDGGSVSTLGGSYNKGTQISITATANSGYRFTGWSNGSLDNPVTVILDSNTILTANFEQVPVYSISVLAEEGGSVSTEGGDYSEGTQLTITATPDEGYEFSGWSDGSTESTRTIQASEDLTLTASFTELENSYQLTVSAGEGGKVSSEGGVYNEGTEVTITASADEGYRFIGWSDGSEEESITITITEEMSIEANFVKIISITVNSNSGGTINIESGEYDQGAELTVIATPNEGYQFIGWDGWANEIKENTFTFVVENNISFSAVFDVFYEGFSVNDVVFDESVGIDLRALETTFYNVSSDFYYKFNDNEFFVHPGTTPYKQDPTPTITLKKSENKWELDKIYRNASMSAPRNYEMIGNEFVIGDSGEHGDQPWLGNIWYGKIGPDNIEWIKVNNPSERTFFHDVSMGDLNADGIIDFIGVPNTSDGYTYGVFMQNSDGTFTKNNQIWKPENDMPFTIDIKDIYGDEKNEIITAAYGGRSAEYGSNNNPDVNRIEVYSFDSYTQSYKLTFRSYQITEYLGSPLGASSIITKDFNNDGILDISVAREEFTGQDEGSFNSIEVWLGDGNGNFNIAFTKVFEFTEIRFREYEVFDANLDGNLDILLRTNGGSDYFLPINESGMDRQGAISLNKSIWLGDGSGSFDYYKDKELIYNFRNSPPLNMGGYNGSSSTPHVINPFMRNGKLVFYGNRIMSNVNVVGYLKMRFIEIEIDLK